MKNTFLICLVLLSLKSCGQEFREEALEQVRYTASSRGYFFEVVATPSLITLKGERGESTPKAWPMPQDTWKAITEEVRKIDLENMEDMEADTEGSSTDRAAMAEVSIRYEGQEFLSPTFDDGTPPKALEPLVNKMLGLAEAVERQ